MTFKKCRNVLNAQLNLLILKIKNDRALCFKNKVFWHTPCCLVLSTPGLERLDRLAQLNWTSSGQRLVFYSWNRLSLLPSSSAPGWKASHCPEVAGLKYYINSHCGEIVQDIFLISLWFMSLSQLKPLIFGIS